MLQLSSMFINRPVLSLRTGTQVATAIAPIINPNNLKIEGLYCNDSASRNQLILLSQDIRDIMPQGIVINDYEVLTDAVELVRLKDVIAHHFDVMGKQVVTTDKAKLGKVSDYAIETNSLYIQKVYASQSFLRSLNGGNLGFDRSQIVEITDKKIVVTDLRQKVPAHAAVPA